MTRVVWRWRCLDAACPERGEGTNSEVQRAAEKHTKAACHGTIAGGVAQQ